MHKVISILCLLGAMMAGLAKSPTTVFSHDTLISGDIEVGENAALSINPGVTLWFSGNFKFIVHGLLIAEGTAEKPIIFTCANRPHGSAEPPCWSGLMIMNKTSHGLFRHCRFEGAYRNLAMESNPVFDSCEFVGNHCGLYCTKNAVAHVKNCKFYRNVYAITTDFANPLLLDNVISDNTIGIYQQTGPQLVSGKNTFIHNQNNIQTEPSLKGDTSASALNKLWQKMDQLH